MLFPVVILPSHVRFMSVADLLNVIQVSTYFTAHEIGLCDEEYERRGL